MNTICVAILATTLFSVGASAMAEDMPTGLFVGLSAGGSEIETSALGLSSLEDSAHSTGAGKISVGYWFNQTWGIEGSYVPMGRFEQTYDVGTFRGKADSYALSLLGRLPINDRWSLVGKMNLTRNQIKDDGSTPGITQFDQLHGTRTNLVLPGIEVNYRINKKMTVLFEVDPRGMAADEVALGYAGFGLRMLF